MENLILDTNIYYKDIKRKTAAFQSLESLIRKSLIKLHVPHFVEREFISQLVTRYEKSYEDIMHNLKQLSEINYFDEEICKKLEQTYFDKNNIVRHAKLHYLSWLCDMKTERCELTLDNYKNTFDDYFEGKSPFKSIKNRKDIPDGLIFQNIKQICSKEKNVHFISEDKEFLTACKGSLANLQTYHSLDDFIKSDICKAFIDVDESEESLVLDYCKNNLSELISRIGTVIPNFLAWKSITSDKIPDDNNEGTIVNSDEPNNINYDFSEVVYYGGGIIVIPCTFEVDVGVSYYLYKADYYAMGKTLSVSDHSDHYYSVEESFRASVEALIRFEFDIQKNEGVEGVYLKNCGVDLLEQIEIL